MKNELLRSVGRLAFELLKLAGLSFILVVSILSVIKFFGGAL